jgi:acyl carrier protein
VVLIESVAVVVAVKTGVLELVTYIEEKYGFKVGDDELVPENLDSVANLADPGKQP